MEAIIPTEIGMPILRTEISKEANSKALTRDLDMIEKLQEAAAIREASSQERMTNLYNRNIKSRAFRAGDLVLRRVFENMEDQTIGKFQPNWEGPYMIVRVGPTGLYALDKLDGTLMPRMWNATHLMRYYH